MGSCLNRNMDIANRGIARELADVPCNRPLMELAGWSSHPPPGLPVLSPADGLRARL